MKGDSKQELWAAADFLQIEKAEKLLVSAPENNRELLMDAASKMGDSFIDIVK